MHVPINMKRPIQAPGGVTEAVSSKIAARCQIRVVSTVIEVEGVQT